MSAERVVKIRVTLKGRPVRTYVFNKDIITVGRNAEADIFLDNPGISRDHMQIVATPYGTYRAEDLNSANGTFVNDVLAKNQNLLDNDTIRVGKFSLWINYEQERRREDGSAKRVSPSIHDGTTVLSTVELTEMIQATRQAEVVANKQKPASGPPSPRPTAPSRTPRVRPVFLVLLAFVVGAAVGAGGVLYWIR